MFRSERRESGANTYHSAPPQTHGDLEPEGADLLQEVPGPAGFLLASAVRDLMAWIEAEPGERPGLFAPDAGSRRAQQMQLQDVPQPLWMPLITVALVTDAPGKVELPRLLDACKRLAVWSDDAGYPATKLAFVQAAALLCPEDAKLAVDVARLARELGQSGRAESWFRHAIRLTRGVDWEAYVWAYVGLGVLYIRSGNLNAAKTVMSRALATATRRRLRALAGVAHHHLFHLTTEAGQIREAYEHVQTALECYGSDHPRLPYLASDLGLHWLARGKPERALELFERVLLVLHDPNECAVASANSTWAAAVAQNRAAYEEYRARTLRLISTARGRAHLDDVYVNLAFADSAIGEWDRATIVAKRAKKLARANGRAQIAMEAESILEAAGAARARPPASTQQEDEGLTRRGNRLAGELLTALGGLSV